MKFNTVQCYNCSNLKFVHNRSYSPGLGLAVKTSLVMQAQPSPASRPGGAPRSPPLPRAAKPLPLYLRVSPRPTPSSKHSPTRLPSPLYSSPSSSPPISPSNYARVPKRTTALSSSPISTAFTSPNDDPQKAKLAQVISPSLPPSVFMYVYVYVSVYVNWITPYHSITHLTM